LPVADAIRDARLLSARVLAGPAKLACASRLLSTHSAGDSGPAKCVQGSVLIDTRTSIIAYSHSPYLKRSAAHVGTISFV
jgi:hypothetical protein